MNAASSFPPISLNPLIKSLQVAYRSTASLPKHLLSSLQQKCSSPMDLRTLHASMMKNNSHQDSFTMNQFLSACKRLHQMDYAFLAFSQMVEPNIFVYNAMMGCFICCCKPVNALKLYVEMPKSQRPTCHTFSHLIKACTKILAIRYGESVHGQIRKMGFGFLILNTGLIDFYSALHKVEDSRKVFDEMGVKDAFSWNTMIFGYTYCGDLDSACTLFHEMPERNATSWNTMIAGFSRLGDVESAESLFHLMPGKNLISWTTIISCYSQNRKFKEAVETFEAMKAAGMNPDQVTMVTVISACAHLGALEMGRGIHYFSVLNGFTLDAYMGSALIDMYAKCGSIGKSFVIFFKLEDKNLFCWNSIIDGLATHGQPKDVFYMFSKMTESQVKPNGVTFVSILSACAHAGMVGEGQRMFLNMIEHHLITPEIEHYSCMVNLLARAGLLQGALDLILSMQIVPNSVIWGALLSGCKIHGKIAIGKIAMERLVVLEPSKRSSHTLLVDMFAEANLWEEAAAVREKIEDMAMQKKSPGCSWIEMDGLVHVFSVSDTSHPLSEEMYLLLVDLYGHIKYTSSMPRGLLG